MKKIITLAATVAICFTLLAGTALAMDAKELIKKSQEASGGLDLITGTQSVMAKGKVMAQGMEFPFTMHQSRPSNMRLEVEIMGMKMIQGYDGETAWTINPWRASPRPSP